MCSSPRADGEQKRSSKTDSAPVRGEGYEPGRELDRDRADAETHLRLSALKNFDEEKESLAA